MNEKLQVKRERKTKSCFITYHVFLTFLIFLDEQASTADSVVVPVAFVAFVSLTLIMLTVSVWIIYKVTNDNRAATVDYIPVSNAGCE